MKFSNDTYLNRISEAPEVALFGEQFFRTNHLNVLAELPIRSLSLFACIAEISRREDEDKVREVVRNIPGIRLQNAKGLRHATFLYTAVRKKLVEYALMVLGWIDGTVQIPVTIPVWLQPGFSKTARSWIAEHLNAAHGVSEEHIQVSQVKNWPLGGVIAVRDLREKDWSKRWFFKVSPGRKNNEQYPATDYDLAIHAEDGVLGKEVCIAEFLRKKFPFLIPGVVASDAGTGYILYEDGGAQKGSKDVGEQVMDAFVEEYVAMQRWAGDHVQELLEAGFGDRRLCRLSDHVREAITRRSIPNLPSFEHLYARLELLCAEIEKEDIPSATIVHGDMHTANLLYNGERLRLTDWAESCLGHPVLEVNHMEPKALRDKYIRALGLSKRVLKMGKPLALLDDFVIFTRLYELEPTYMRSFANIAKKCLRMAIFLLKIR